MKSNSPSLVFVSCYQSDLPEVGNAKNHHDLVEKLELLNVPFFEAEGCYKGKREKTIVMDSQYTRVADMIMREYNQESYLVHNNDRECCLVYSDGACQKIGVLEEISEQESVTLDAWTSVLTEKGKRFFTVK